MGCTGGGVRERRFPLMVQECLHFRVYLLNYGTWCNFYVKRWFEFEMSKFYLLSLKLVCREILARKR